MGLLEAEVAENLTSVLGFTIAWVLPVAVAFGLVWVGYRLKTPNKQVATVTHDATSVVLDDMGKAKITDLMETVNALNDRMDRYVNESLYHEGDRVAHYQSLVDSSEFQGLWDKCSAQSAQVIVISPELHELVRNMLRLTQSHHRHFLREWYEHQMSQLSRETDEHITAIEIFRKRIQQVLEQLIEGS